MRPGVGVTPSQRPMVAQGSDTTAWKPAGRREERPSPRSPDSGVELHDGAGESVGPDDDVEGLRDRERTHRRRPVARDDVVAGRKMDLEVAAPVRGTRGDDLAVR